MNVILASQSPRRRELLATLYKTFTVMTADTDEVIAADEDLTVAAMSLAFQKAVAVQVNAPNHHLIIAADTIVDCDGVFGKPVDNADAKRMLRALSGRTHRVITGVAIVESGTNRKRVFFSETQVEMRPLSEAEIDWYVASGEPDDKAGAYGIQGLGAQFIPRIEGDYYTVMGLPIARLADCIKCAFPDYAPMLDQAR